ncbi:unnamed protein product [Laminaria digitata]
MRPAAIVAKCRCICGHMLGHVWTHVGIYVVSQYVGTDAARRRNMCDQMWGNRGGAATTVARYGDRCGHTRYICCHQMQHSGPCLANLWPFTGTMFRRALLPQQ